MSRSDDWAPGWVAQRLVELDQVERCSEIGGPVLEVVRTKGLPDINVACISVDVLDSDVALTVLAESADVKFVLNVPANARITGEAIGILATRGVAVGGVGDAMRALREPDPGSYQHKDWQFVERGLAQHTAIESFTLLDRGRYRVERRDRDPITVAVINDYEVTADSVRQVIEKYPALDLIVTSNPNALQISDQAKTAASAAGVSVALWRDFYGSLRQ